MLNNNVSESLFQELTCNIDRFSMIRLANAGGLLLDRQNGSFNWKLIFARNQDKGNIMEL